MGKIKNPVRFGERFGVTEESLLKLGALDPILNGDTRLFIDPLLLCHSKHAEMSSGALKTYEKHFGKVIRLLAGSKTEGDAAWRSAHRLMKFPEVKWTCLGYGGTSVAGSGSGPYTTDCVMNTAKEIVDLGITDPDLFVVMAVFEEGIGPDRISDMATNVIMDDLLAFNNRILAKLNVPVEATTLRLKNGKTFYANLPINPFEIDNSPIVLVPTDILRDLPIANDWSDVADSAGKNADLRNKVNEQIAEIWQRKTLKRKGELKKWAMSSQKDFKTFIALIKDASGKSYDIEGDPNGELVWLRLAEQLAEKEPFRLDHPARKDITGIMDIVEKIIGQFRFLIEERRYSEELYHNDKPRHERSAQRLFFACAYAYCKANNIDITPEADTGNGPVDFKFATGFDGRVLVEIKLSTNSSLEDGYTRQLQTYLTAEETTKGYYVVIDVGRMGQKAQRLLNLKNGVAEKGKQVSAIEFIDGIRKPSASKLK